MEQLLWLYSLPYDPRYPVVCFDERPCFLIGDRIERDQLYVGLLSDCFERQAGGAGAADPGTRALRILIR